MVGFLASALKRKSTNLVNGPNIKNTPSAKKQRRAPSHEVPPAAKETVPDGEKNDISVPEEQGPVYDDLLRMVAVDKNSRKYLRRSKVSVKDTLLVDGQPGTVQAQGHVDVMLGRRPQGEDMSRKDEKTVDYLTPGQASGPLEHDPWQVHFDGPLTQDDRAEALGQVKFVTSSSLSAADTREVVEVQCAGCSLPAAPSTLEDCFVRDRLCARWREVHHQELCSEQEGPSSSSSTTTTTSGSQFTSPRQREFFSLCNSYCDVFLTDRAYPTNVEGGDGLMDAYLLHALNHCAKTGDRIKKNNERLRANSNGGGGDEGPAGVPRDQGFTRPRVLFLLPMRNLAYQLIRRLVQLAQKETRSDSVQGKEKFVEQFGPLDDEEEDLDEADRERRAQKPDDFRLLFSGNVDDHFRIGIKITRGSIRLFADLYQSDVIVASPIALATKFAEGSGDNTDESSDFLSSIEVLIIDRADVLLMQNWSHVTEVLDQMNRVPHQQHGVDIMRVREWYLEGQAAKYRQTILLSSFPSVEMNHLVSHQLVNHAGKVRTKTTYRGVLSRVIPQVQQSFEQYFPSSPAEASDCRLDYFKRHWWPRIQDISAAGLMIFVPSYFDFVRLRNFLLEEEASFVALCEYTKTKDVTRSRAYFVQQRRRIMLYTERAHFYHRYRIKGVKDIMFYSLPEHNHFYAEVVNMLQGSSGSAGTLSTVAALYSRYDALALERIVGSSRARKMTTSQTPSFLFY